MRLRESDVAEIMETLTALFPRQVIPPKTADLYARYLGDLEKQEVLSAIDEHVVESQFFPTVAEIRQRAAQRAVGAPPIDAALAEVQREVRRVGYYGVPKFSHPSITAAMASIGWQAWCSSDADQQGTLRAQFERYYTSARATAVKAENVGKLEAASPLAALAGDVTKRLTVGGKR